MLTKVPFPKAQSYSILSLIKAILDLIFEEPAERKIEVLKLVIPEKNSKELAKELFISERTVETHRKNMIRKTSSSSTVGLIKYAYQHKLV